MIKVTPSSITRIRLIIYIEDPKETLSVNHIHVKEDTEAEEITKIDITTTSYPVGSDAISTINRDIS